MVTVNTWASDTSTASSHLIFWKSPPRRGCHHPGNELSCPRSHSSGTAGLGPSQGPAHSRHSVSDTTLDQQGGRQGINTPSLIHAPWLPPRAQSRLGRRGEGLRGALGGHGVGDHSQGSWGWDERSGSPALVWGRLYRVVEAVMREGPGPGIQGWRALGVGAASRRSDLELGWWGFHQAGPRGVNRWKLFPTPKGPGNKRKAQGPTLLAVRDPELHPHL